MRAPLCPSRLVRLLPVLLLLALLALVPAVHSALPQHNAHAAVPQPQQTQPPPLPEQRLAERRSPSPKEERIAGLQRQLASLLLERDAAAAPTPDVLRRQQTADEVSESQLPTGVSRIDTQPSATLSSVAHDPLLAIMPDFAFSMPSQIVVNGINLALVVVLSVHLLFTAQYHFPLSSRNYILQAISTAMLLISLSVQMHIVLAKLRQQSNQWPYMFAYIGVQIPPQDGSWTTVQEAFFLLMRACTTALAHLTHIQFLTLLFPSALEARLILWMLGPLALAASGMEFTALSAADDVKTSDLGDAVRNICNSALTLLYTSALLIWGLLVNRRRAWRTDGGTAAFGAGSVGLAIINTAISFVEIAFDRVWWLPDMCWTLTIWQSWLGFWWWVGSGMGIGEVEDRAERQERQRKREERLKRKRERADRQRRKAEAAAASVDAEDMLGGIKRLRNRLAGETKDASSSIHRRLRRGTRGAGESEGIELQGIGIDAQSPGSDDAVTASAAAASGSAAAAGEVELQSVSVVGSGAASGSAGAALANAEDARTTAASSSDTHPTATSGPGWLGSAFDYMASHQPNFIRRRMKRLRLAHAAAARRAATEQTALRDQVLNAGRPQGPGLRTMMFNERGRPSSEQAQGGSRRTSGAGVGGSGQGGGHGAAAPAPLQPLGEMPGDTTAVETGGDTTSGESSSLTRRHPGTTSMRSARRRPSAGAAGEAPRVRSDEDQAEDDWVDELGPRSAPLPQRLANDGSGMPASPPPQSMQQSLSSWSFRGPLASARRTDRSTYD